MLATDQSARLSNNSNESGILIYNKMPKASSTTVASYMFKFAAQNNNTHKHCPFGHYFMTYDMKTERKFLRKHYDYANKPLSTDQHIVFVNAVEDYGFEEYERPNWINFVRQPIERLVSHFYYFKHQKEQKPHAILTKVLQDIVEDDTVTMKPFFERLKEKKKLNEDKKNLVSRNIQIYGHNM